jgi:hypothetical protein
MAVILKEVIINLPVEPVFAFVAETPNLVEVWPSLIEVKDWKRGNDGLAEFGFVYQVAGFRYRGLNRDIEFVQNRKIVTNSSGGMEAVVSWEFEPHPMGTKVVFTGDYTVEIPLIGRVISERIAALNGLEVESMLLNMKKKLEAQ